MVGFVAGVVVTAILFIIYIKTSLIPQINQREKVAYRKGWEACRKDVANILMTTTCKRSDE